MKNFGLIGAGGYVAPRHMQAIRETGNSLVVAVDKHDSVGTLDSYFLHAQFFTEVERFEAFLEEQQDRSPSNKIHYVSICSPNYLHYSHICLALRHGAHAICEKPLVIDPADLGTLVDLEAQTGCRVFHVTQARIHPSVVALNKNLKNEQQRTRTQVTLTYITPRGPWYLASWKGMPTKSGGLAMNAGIHLFDLLIWLFGTVRSSEVHLSQPTKMAGFLELEWADVSWFLSLDSEDLPRNNSEQRLAIRTMTVDGEEFDMSKGFENLHTRLYEEILAGRGFGISDARPSLELTRTLLDCAVVPSRQGSHPFLAQLPRH